MARAPTSPPHRAGAAQRGHGLAVALLLLTVLVFAGSTSHDFVNYDDRDYVTENSAVLRGLTAANLRWALTAGVASNWHPLTWWSHMADVSLFGLSPAGHHATSVFWHALNAALAFCALRALTGSVWRSAVCAALFALHPLRVESVAWVAERKDVLSGAFFFATLWAYARFVRGRIAGERGVRWYVGAWLLFGLGLMAKPMLVTLPFLLLLLDGWPLGRFASSVRKRSLPVEIGWAIVEKLPLFALSVGSSVVTYIVQSRSGAVTAALSIGDRVATALVSVPRYVGKWLWPVDLAVLYPHPGHWRPSLVFVSAIVCIGVSLGTCLLARRRPWLLVGWFWFLGMLVPVSGLVQVGLQSMADRYTYLPSVGLGLVIVWTAGEWLGSRPARIGSLALIALGALTVLTLAQLTVWQNSITLFRHTLAVAGAGNYLAHDNLGIALEKSGDAEAAIREFRAALALNPTYPNANNNLARALAARGELAEAVALYRVALQAKPDDLEIHNNAANALADVGALDEAIEHYAFVLKRNPRHANALNGHAVALAMKGRLAEAEAAFGEILRGDPDNVSALSNLGNVLALQGRREEAAGLYERVLQREPNDPRTAYNLGNLRVELGQLELGAASFERAIAHSPANPEAHTALASVLLRLGRRDEAIRHLTLALQQRPGFAPAQATLNALRGATP